MSNYIRSRPSTPGAVNPRPLISPSPTQATKGISSSGSRVQPATAEQDKAGSLLYREGSWFGADGRRRSIEIPHKVSGRGGWREN